MRPFLITAGQAGRLLGLTRQRVADLTRSGTIPVYSLTPGGRRRYEFAVIQRIAEERAAAKATTTTASTSA